MTKEKLNFTACGHCNEPLKVGNTYYEVEINKTRIICCEKCLKELQEQQTELFDKRK